MEVLVWEIIHITQASLPVSLNYLVFLIYMKDYIKRLLKIESDKGYAARYTFEYIVRFHENVSLLKKEVGGSFLDDGFRRFKKSDTLFILGSGPSINAINTDQWDEIKSHDSLGFNFWFVHEFIPTFYFLQFTSSIELRDSIVSALSDKYEGYRNVPFILRGNYFAESGLILRDNEKELLKKFQLFYLKEYPIHSKVEMDIDVISKALELQGMMKFNEIASFTPKLRSSITLLILWAYQMGYKKIVLCGVDMNVGVTHFWDDPMSLDILKKYNLDIIKATARDFSHFTSKKFSKNTIPEYIYHLRAFMEARAGVELYVMSKETVLYPEIPIYQ